MLRNTFIATVEGDSIYAINSVSQERAEVGITKKPHKNFKQR